MKKSGCSSKAAMVLASVVLLAAEGAFLCPAHHCLMQIGQGTGAAAFSCEQYPESDGYECGKEADTCNCAGFVKYGDFPGNKAAPSFENATWTAEKTVSDKIACTNAAFGEDPIHKGSKFCFCRPSSPATSTRSTKAPVTEATAGYVAPKCFITQAGITVNGGGMVLDAPTLYSMGGSRGLMGYFEKKTLDDYFNATGKGSRIVAEDPKAVTYTWQVPCDGSTDTCYGSPELALQHVLTLRSDSKPYSAAFGVKWSAAKSFLGAQMAALGPAVVHTFKQLPATTSTTAGTVTTTAVPGDNATTTGGLMVSGATRAFATKVIAVAVLLGSKW